MNDKKTHIMKLVDPDYIGAYSLDGIGDKTVTIEKVNREEVTGDGGIKDYCVVVHLKGEKPFILNATNRKSIVKLYGNHIEDWAGKNITIYATTTKSPKGIVDCLRVREKVPQAEPTLPEAIKEVQTAGSREALDTIWKKHKSKQKTDEFVKAVQSAATRFPAKEGEEQCQNLK